MSDDAADDSTDGIVLQDSANGVRPDQLVGFFEGWPTKPSVDAHLRVLRGSREVVLAIDPAADAVVGFATAVTDGVLTAYIPLLEVLPAYRSRGLGDRIMRRLLARLDRFYQVDLVCDPEVCPFYERLGLRKGIAMSLRRRDRLPADPEPA